MSVSVVIPVFDGRRYLAEAIESVLAQGVAGLELVVVDDGSSDGSHLVAEGFGDRVRCLRRAHAGLGATRNAGLAAARGELVAWLDADDLWTPGRLALQLEVLRADAGLDAVAGHVAAFVSPELRPSDHARFTTPPESRPAFVLGATLMRRSFLERVGPFPTELAVGVDMAWHLRALAVGCRLRMLPDVVLRRRLHRTNVGLTRRHLIGQRLRVIKAELDRRRGERG